MYCNLQLVSRCCFSVTLLKIST